MIGGIIMVLVAIWIHQTAVKVKLPNSLLWTAGAAVIFFVTQVVLIEVNIGLFDLDGTKTESKAMLGSSDKVCEPVDANDKSKSKVDKEGDMGGLTSNCSNVHGEDRQDKERYQGFGGALKSLYFELFPQILSFLLIAFLRLKYITKEELSVGNLFSGLKEMFSSIKDSFKTSAQ